MQLVSNREKGWGLDIIDKKKLILNYQPQQTELNKTKTPCQMIYGQNQATG